VGRGKAREWGSGRAAKPPDHSPPHTSPLLFSPRGESRGQGDERGWSVEVKDFSSEQRQQNDEHCNFPMAEKTFAHLLGVDAYWRQGVKLGVCKVNLDALPAFCIRTLERLINKIAIHADR